MNRLENKKKIIALFIIRYKDDEDEEYQCSKNMVIKERQLYHKREI